MATVQTNPLVNGLSGMLGRTIVFKVLRGKTIMTSFPRPPNKQSEQQRINRGKFKEATFWAKTVLKDPLKKEYYQKQAKKLKLPNAYTAAITEYMRKLKTAKPKYELTGNIYLSKQSEKTFINYDLQPHRTELHRSPILVGTARQEYSKRQNALSQKHGKVRRDYGIRGLKEISLPKRDH